MPLILPESIFRKCAFFFASMDSHNSHLMKSSVMSVLPTWQREKWNGWRSGVFGDIPQIKTAQDEVCHWKKTWHITILRRCEELDWGEPQGWVQLRSQVCSPKTNAVALRSRTHSGLSPGLAPAGNSSKTMVPKPYQKVQNSVKSSISRLCIWWVSWFLSPRMWPKTSGKHRYKSYWVTEHSNHELSGSELMGNPGNTTKNDDLGSKTTSKHRSGSSERSWS